MSSSALSRLARSSLVVAAVAVMGCQPITAPEYVYGENITGQLFTIDSEDAGIHPNLDVLLDDNNPFKEYGIGGESRWDILAEGGNVATFYAWATWLTQQPEGEAQFYTGTALQAIYELEEVTDDKSLPTVRKMAIRAYQSVLDNFPESVTFDASGERSSRLATFAFNRIIDMGGQVQGDWVLVETPAGGTEAVRSNNVDPPRPDEDADEEDE
jgi:hypothetical protein